MDATSPRCCALLPLTAVAYRSARYRLPSRSVSALSKQVCVCSFRDALSTPIIFQRLPGFSVPQARLEFCHLDRGRVDVELLEFLRCTCFGSPFVAIHSLRPGRARGVRSFWKQFVDLPGSAFVDRTPLRTLLWSSLLSGHDTFAATG